MTDICGDNRFEIIEAAKQRLIEATNIESRPEEMAVIDSVLFRMWQMGWLPGCERYERTCHNVGGEEGTNFEHYDFACDSCWFASDVTDPNYCPECGAKVLE